MARRLAAVGYYVVLPNLYYRRARDFGCAERTEPRWPTMFELMATLDAAMTVRDTRGDAAFVDAQPEADASRIGAVGYCMSGPFVMSAAAAFPDRIACIASIHGANMATDSARLAAPHGADASAARATSRAPRSTSGRRRPTSTKLRGGARSGAGRRTGSSGTRARSTASCSRSRAGIYHQPSPSGTGSACSRCSSARSERGFDAASHGAGCYKALRPLPQEHAMTGLKPAAELAAGASQPYPNDSAEYRRARTALLAEEIELRRHIERVAAQRRALPPGGEAPRLPLQGRGRQTSTWPTCSAGTTRSSPTSGCTARSASGRARCAPPSSARWTSRRATSRSGSRSPSIGRSPVERQLAFARERGWRNLEVLRDRRRRLRARLPRPRARRQRVAGARRLGQARRQGPPLLGRRDRRHRRSRPGPARRARPDAAVERARPHARRARHRLVSEAGLPERRLRSRRAESPTTQPGAAR